MLIMNRPAVPTFLFIEFSEQAHFTGWAQRVIYMQTDTALRGVNQLSYATEPEPWQLNKKTARLGGKEGGKNGWKTGEGREAD